MTFTRLLGAVAMIGALGACIEERAEVATITLDYLTSAQAEALAQPYLSPDGRLFRSDAALNTITVRDRRKNVHRVQSLLNERDASPQNVSLHFQVVRATAAGGIDPQLAKVGNALRELLRFEGYQLVAQTVVSASERRIVEQSINVGSLPMQLGVRINDIVGGSGSVDMEVDLRRAGHASLLTTNVVVPMGQTVVLGSAYPGADGEALILTVRGERGSTKLRTSSRRREVDHLDAAHVDVAIEAARAEAAVAAAAADIAASQAAIAAEADAMRAELEARAAGGTVYVPSGTKIRESTLRKADQVRVEVVPKSPMPARSRGGSVPPDGQR